MQFPHCHHSPTQNHKTSRVQMYGFVCACLTILCAYITPAVFGQHNVHAALIAQAARKPAPTFDLVAENGNTVQIP